MLEEISKDKINYLKKKANCIRNKILDMCVRAGTGHVTSSFSCTELLVALYHGGILRYNPSDPEWEGRDRFVLSKGQASPILYSILADVGFFSIKELDKFNQEDGIFGVHLQRDVPGAEITSGALGHGFGIATGMALAGKMNKKQYFVFTLLGDGECHEGSIWETAMFASHHQLNNLIAIVDRNWLCATDFTENCVRLNPLDKKWISFGWDVANINGHSFEEIFDVIDGFRSNKRNRPLVIIADTVKGKGVSFLENQIFWHGVAPKGEEAKQAKRELNTGGGN